jgi:hypothetical protein
MREAIRKTKNDTERRCAMATESIGKTVHMDNEFADRFIEMEERMAKNPPPPNTREIKWGDPDEIAKALRREYGYEE